MLLCSIMNLSFIKKSSSPTIFRVLLLQHHRGRQLSTIQSKPDSSNSEPPKKKRLLSSLDNSEREKLIVAAVASKGRLGLSPRLHTNTDYHAADGLPGAISDWTLLYNNKSTLWLMIVCGIYSTLAWVLIATGAEEIRENRHRYDLRQQQHHEEVAAPPSSAAAAEQAQEESRISKWKQIISRTSAISLLGGLAIFCTLTRYRRVWVVRVYERNLAGPGRRPEPVIVPSGAPPPKTTPTSPPLTPTREYCIVWVNWLFRRRLYFYDNQETARATESTTPFMANVLGNFTARGRPWAVFQHYFDDALDYYRVRGKRVAGGKFIG